jgi:hypothetical protein
MLTIHKYPIIIQDCQQLHLPDKSKVLTVQMQNGNPFIWILCDPEQPTKPRTFLIYGTGHPIHHIADKHYIGTFQTMDGNSNHLFEEII